MIELLLTAPLLPLTITLYNVATWRRGRELWSKETTVSVLIPARNEVHRISPTLEAIRSARTLDGELIADEILVCDDDSTDGTAAIVAKFSQQDSRFRLIRSGPLASGWVGKPHACESLRGAATCETLVFLDADVTLKPGGLSRLLSLLGADVNADLVTAVPEQIAISPAERLILPFLVLTYTSWLPLRLVERGRDKRTVAANGQLLAMRQATAVALGGFTAVKGAVVDDVELCRHAKTLGKKVVFADGSRMATCRMYQSTHEVWRGFSKNLAPGLGGKPSAVFFVIALYLTCFVLPYATLTLIFIDLLPEALLATALLGVGANLVLRTLLALRYRQPIEQIFLHPFGALFLCAIAINSLIWSLRGRIEWSGRTYGKVSP